MSYIFLYDIILPDGALGISILHSHSIVYRMNEDIRLNQTRKYSCSVSVQYSDTALLAVYLLLIDFSQRTWKVTHSNDYNSYHILLCECLIFRRDFYA